MKMQFIKTITLLLVISSLSGCFSLFSQTIIIDEPFNASIPSGWTADASSWSFTTSYSSGIAPTTSRCASISSGKSNRYMYIPITITTGYTYDISFYAKRICGFQVYINETADQLTPLYSYSGTAGCNNSWPLNTCFQWVSTYTGTAYLQIAYTGSTYGSSTAYVENIKVVETAPACTSPTTAPSGISFSSVTTSSTTVNWIGNGDGDMVLVVAKESGSTHIDPSIGSSYAANAVFGSGTEIGTGNFVVYDADGTTQSVTVTGLSSGTTYDYSIYAYNSSGYCYYLAAYETASQATLCAPPGTSPSGLIFSSVGATSMNISWINGSGSNVLVVVQENGATHTDPSPGVTYTANSSFGSGDEIGTGNYVCYSGTGTTFTLTGLTGSTTYNVSVYTFDTSPTCYNLTEEYDSQTTTAFNTFYINDNSLIGDVFTSTVGNDSNSGGTTDPFATITAAIAAASDGDVIYIDAGTYNNWETITLSKELNFIGAGSDLTIIDDQLAGASTNYFMYVTANNVSFKEMTIQGYENNGSQTPGHSGQALTIGNNSTGVLIEDVIMSANGASGGNPSIVVLANCSVTIRRGGGVCNVWQTMYTGGVESYGSGITLNIENYVFAYNFKEGGYDGAGLLINNTNSTTTVNVSNCYFFNNVASDGGAISQRNGVLNVTDCIFDGNMAGQIGSTIYGGGVRMSGGTATYIRCRFVNNGSNGDGTIKGGAIGLWSGNDVVDLTLDNCYFDGNSANQGVDIYADEVFSKNINVTATNTTFSTSTYSIYNKDANTIQLTDCGDPVVYGSVNKVNTNAPSSVPNPSTPGIVAGDCGTGIVLPVEMVKFYGSCKDGNIELNWTTLSESNNNYFVVEKSDNAKDYTEAGVVEGSGSSNQLINYIFNDKSPFDAINYYRLKQVDYNGDINYSNTISVINDCKKQDIFGSLYFDKLSDQIVISVDDNMDDLKVSIYDISGKLLYLKNDIRIVTGNVYIQADFIQSNSIYIIHISNSILNYTDKLFINKD